MKIEEFAEIKERMLIAKEQGDMKIFKKYYDLFVKGYEEITGKNFEEEMKKRKEGQERDD